MSFDPLCLPPMLVITGHYGSGKTNLTINLAVDLAKAGDTVTVVDLDIVNPYFRTTDHQKRLERLGIRLISPRFAGSNVDLPAISEEVYSTFAAPGRVIFDVGGDDAGAAALGRFHAHFEKKGAVMMTVINHYRYLTRTAADAVAILREMEAISRMRCALFADNSNLGPLTRWEDILNATPFCEQFAGETGIRLCCRCVPAEVAKGHEGELAEVYPISVYVKPPWA